MVNANGSGQRSLIAALVAGVVVWGLGDLARLAARQTPQREQVDAAIIAKIKDEGLNHSQAWALFTMLVDEIGPRLTGSPAHRRAADYMRDMAERFGLSDAHLEPWEFGRGWVLDKLTIEMVEPRYMPLIGYAEAWSPSTAGEVLAPALDLAGKSADQIEAMRAGLRGAAVLQQPIVTTFITADRIQPTAVPDLPGPAAPAATRALGPASAGGGRQGRGGRSGAAAEARRITAAIAAGGASVLLKPSRGTDGTVFVQAATRETPGDTLPKMVLAGEHYNMIARLLARNVPVKLRVNVQAHLTDDRQSYNVIAEIPGTDPALRDQVVMLGAHLDSWHAGTGATDNADGAAAVLEAFRILKAIGVRPRRTLRLALWSGEEEGLLGSRAWVQAHLAGDAHRAEREAMDVYFNIDPGKGPIYGWYLQDNDAVRPIFDAWLAPFLGMGAVRNVRQGIGSTDHVSFIAAGVPAFNPVQDYVDYDVRLHHTNADTAEHVRLEDLEQNAIILAAFVYHAAMRDGRIPSGVSK
jgi:carboxypeptidase Q